jgi:hypothetical protein
MGATSRRVYVPKFVLCCEQNMQTCVCPLTLSAHKVGKRQRGYVHYVWLFQPCWTDSLSITHRLMARSKNGRYVKCWIEITGIETSLKAQDDIKISHTHFGYSVE